MTEIEDGGLVYQCIRISQELARCRKEIIIGEYRLARFIHQMTEDELATLNSYLDKQPSPKTTKEILQQWKEEMGGYKAPTSGADFLKISYFLI